MEPAAIRLARLLGGGLTPTPPAAPATATGLQAAITPVALVLGNLVPLAGVLFWGWDVASLVIFYWSENLVVGAFTVLKMLVRSPIGGIFSSLFFTIHYGGFCAVHGLFAMMFFGYDMDGALSDIHWPIFFVFVELLFKVVRQVISVAPAEWLWGFTALAASHGVSFVTNYLWRGGHRTTDLSKLMRAPYGRIVVLHLAVLGGGFFVMSIGSPLPVLVFLVLGKIALDLSLHLKEHGFTLRLPHATRIPASS